MAPSISAYDGEHHGTNGNENGWTESDNANTSAGQANGHNTPHELNGSSAQHNTTNGCSSEDHNDLHSIPIAICGMGVRLPGGIRSASELYDFLANKRDAKTIVPKERYNVDAYYDPAHKTGTLATPYGYFLDEDLTQFDASMFSMSNAEIASMDPSQRLLLEVTREAFESAGEANFRGKNIGTFVGDFTTGWEDLQDSDFLHSTAHKVMGKIDFVLPNRLSYEYDLVGPSVLAKTACSATAEALNLAVTAIRTGSCPSAIVAGANLILTPRASIEMSVLGVLAPDGDCKTFDARANGFARGESACALYIKPLADAIRDGNPVRAVIRAIDSNADGGDGTRTFGTPNPKAQEALIRKTYAAAGLPLSDTKVIELHGTGTPVGDPLETAAIASCFGGAEEVYIGSVKPNLGHGEGGSAMASIIKSVLALESRTVLPNIKFETPNPRIPWDRNLVVPTETRPWPLDVPERVSVNSFGLGGSNVHIVLDSAASAVPYTNGVATNGSCQQIKHLLPLSGNSEQAIKAMAQNYGRYLEQNPQNVESMAYTLAWRRERLKLRSYCVVDGSKITEPAPSVATKESHRVAFVFTGQGAQWVGMAQEMLKENEHFANSIRIMDAVLQSLEHPPAWRLEDLLLSEKADKDLFNTTDISQPVSTAIQIAYVDTLAAWQVTPAAVVGHSSGEVAAAYASGALSRREAIVTSYYRGYACARNKIPGGMAAIGMGREEVAPFLQPGVVLACDNSNASVTLSGDLQGLDDTMLKIKEAMPDMFVRKLRVPMGYHSSHMSSVADLYHSLIAHHLTPKAPNVPWYSTVYGKRITEAKVSGPQYWIHNMERPALFRTAASMMLTELGNDIVHLEIGPHSALAGPLRQIYKETGQVAPYVAVAERGEDAATTFLQAMGKLHSLGIDAKVPITNHVSTLPDLPAYPWHYAAPHWSESRLMHDYRYRKHRKHELLGLRSLESSDTEPSWRNLLRLGDVPWLADHCVEKDIVFPAAGYIAMAGAATYQLTGSKTFTVQEVNISAAMLVAEQGVKEIITTLRKRDWTTTNTSKWWEFTITSENNGTWIKHCWGLVTDGCSLQLPRPEVRSFSRKVNSGRWYHTMARVGLNYGPRFRGLEDITADPVDQAATACVTDRQEDPHAYALHPSTLDIILQSQSVAITRGQYREFDALWLPTFVDQFYIGDAGNQKALKLCTSSVSTAGTTVVQSYGAVEDDVAFVLKGLRGTKMADSTTGNAAGQDYWSIEWHPAMNFAPISTLIRPAADVTAGMAFIERFSLMCAAEIQQEAATIATRAQPHFEYFLAGIAKQLANISDWQELVPDAQELKAMTRKARQQEIAECRKRSRGTRLENTIELTWRVCANIRDILEGRVAYLDIALQDETLPKFYDESNSLSSIDDFFAVLGLNKPHLRILEIGAGTGGTTACALKALQSQQGERLFQEYTITDVSAGFVNQCRQRFAAYNNLKYAVLDITADPLGQGFEAGTYDLIIASNVLHATPNLVETLKRCRSLIKPEGYLFLQELCSNTRNIDLVMGLFDGWWVGRDDGRPDRAVVSIDTWESKLTQSGFAGIDAAIKDNNHPQLFACANIVARPVTVPADIAKRVTLLTPSTEPNLFALGVREALVREGYEVDHCVWKRDNIPTGQDIVSFMDVEPSGRPLLADVDTETLETFTQLLADVAGQLVLWLMPLAQVHCTDPHYGQILGMARCIRAELGSEFVTLELDDYGEEASKAVSQLLVEQQRARFTVTGSVDELEIESEYVWTNDTMLVSRMHVESVQAKLEESISTVRTRHLAIQQPGMLQTMEWTCRALPSLPADHVQVRMTNVGLNFHDVAVAMGIMDPETMEDDGYHGLGCEGSAIVTAIGKDVGNFKIGDRVVVMDVLNAVFATETQVPAILCARIPDNVSDEDAAGLVIPYLTVLWSLMEKAHIKRGQSLLIHSAAGGVGIAAIHVARWLGADFYCTVGSSAKIDFLEEKLGVARDRIFHSRSDSFVEDVLTATRGRGVDVVLNSLSGELLHASWKCVAPGGCMLDLGKRDFLGRGRLAMLPFAENRAFFGVDLAALAMVDPTMVVPFLERTMQLLRDGHIFPLHPTTLLEADKVADAFRYMQKGVHTGRIVVRMPTDPESLPAKPPKRDLTFRSNGVYLLAGGLGGLGLSIISWMISRGARNFAVISPSAGSRTEHHEFVEELRQQGCELLCFAGDISDADCVRGVIQKIGQRINGVVQLAMVLCDTGFLNMDHRSWTTATLPKTQGTWNLHELLPTDMDFFVMCSSAAGTVGSYGQSNYAAGNAYLDAFVQYRHDLGLPASVLDIAAVGDVGYVASSKDVAERLERNIARFMTENDFLQCFELLVERSSARYITKSAATPTTLSSEAGHLVLFNEMTRPLGDPQSGIPWRGDPRVSIIRNNQDAAINGSGKDSESLRSFLLALAAEPERLDDPATVDFFAQEIAKRVFAFLMVETATIDTSQTLTSMGADSLVAIEIRNWWKQTFGVDISALELADASNTMEGLGRLAVQRLTEKYKIKK